MEKKNVSEWDTFVYHFRKWCMPYYWLKGSFNSQPCPILWDPKDYSLPGSSVHGDSPHKRLEWIAMSSSRGSFQPTDKTQVSLTAGGFFTVWATKKTQEYWIGKPIPSPEDLPNSGIELGSPALQADSLPVEQPESTVQFGVIQKWTR